MKFNATDAQILKIAARAVNASKPMGMGFLHATDRHFKPSDFKDDLNDRGLSLDYVEGRMVKLHISRDQKEKDLYEILEPRYSYQSWIAAYKNVEDLIRAAGVTQIVG